MANASLLYVKSLVKRVRVAIKRALLALPPYIFMKILAMKNVQKKLILNKIVLYAWKLQYLFFTFQQLLVQLFLSF